jgi:hypothetical protein
METQKSVPIASISLCMLLLATSVAPAWADGTLTHMSGPVSVQKPDGRALPGMIGAKVEVGDIVMTGAGGYARMEMTDGGEMVLRPDSQLKVESYSFVEAKPAQDSFIFSMLKGGLRTVTGLIGKRGRKEAYEGRTVTATIGVRGTQYDMRVCQANCGALADGTYLAVRYGAIQTSNAQGTLAVAAGQVAFVAPQRSPVMLPRDPGIGFTPPAVIPKLDEKKKVQAAVAIAAANAADQAKSAATGSGPSAQTPPRSGQASSADSTAKTEGSGTGSNTGSKDSGGTNSGVKSTGQAASGNSASTPQIALPADTPASSASSSASSQSTSGTECSVQ